MNDRSMTKTKAETLAAFLASVRTDWQTPGIVAALGNAKQRPDKPDAFQIAIAAVRAAAEPTNRTPAVIALDGNHWRPANPDESPKVTPTAPHVSSLRCPSCGFLKVRHEIHTCGKVADPHQGRALAQAQLDAARAAIQPTATYDTPTEETPDE